MRAIDPAHFPNVVASLRDAGLDPTRELIPVAPAAHYMMGGIVTDLTRAPRSPACTPSASPPAPACTAPTASPPTRSASASCSPVAPSLDALSHADRRAARGKRWRAAAAARAARAAIATPDTRAALWRDAGVVRTPEGLASLLDDPHPLARLIATLRARAHREPRRAPARRPSRARPRIRLPPRRARRGSRHRLADLALRPPLNK